MSLFEVSKLKEMIKEREKDDKVWKIVLWVLAIIGVIAAVAGIAYAIYRYMHPDYLEEFEDEFDDDFFKIIIFTGTVIASCQ